MAACLMDTRFVLLWNVFMTLHGSFVMAAIPVAFWTREILPTFRNADNLTAPCNIWCCLIFSSAYHDLTDWELKQERLYPPVWCHEYLQYQWNHIIQATSGTNQERQELQTLLQVGSCQCLKSDVAQTSLPSTGKNHSGFLCPMETSLHSPCYFLSPRSFLQKPVLFI